MTCIAYHYEDKQIAVDSQATNGYDIVSNIDFDKTITNDLGIWFFTGTRRDSAELSKLRHNEKVSNVDNKPDISAMVISEGEVYFVNINKDGYCKWQKEEANAAIGTGDFFALSAMDFGKTAKEAVEYAMTRDIYTGGRVRVFDVK